MKSFRIDKSFYCKKYLGLYKYRRVLSILINIQNLVLGALQVLFREDNLLDTLAIWYHLCEPPYISSEVVGVISLYILYSHIYIELIISFVYVSQLTEPR